MTGRWASGEQVQSVRKGFDDRSACLLDAGGASGKVDDDAACADPGNAAREHPMGRVCLGCLSHRLRYAGYLALDDRARRLWRDIARREARAAGGEHELAKFYVNPVAQALFDRLTDLRLAPIWQYRRLAYTPIIELCQAFGVRKMTTRHTKITWRGNRSNLRATNWVGSLWGH